MDHQTARTVRYLGRYYRQLPQTSRFAVGCLIVMLLLLQAEHLGEALGKTLYYLTH